ncbi:hypothetical protein LIER_36477 [Lithospermum erythrorhizon]|uniref:Uncharacterized protein n=1 Tax=Lithospermum erythrorhizon TaxID=34254 RepID=A0AAV3PAR4_LITER
MNTQPIRPTFAALRALLLKKEGVNQVTKSMPQDSAMLLYSSASQKPSTAPSRSYSNNNQKFKGKFFKNKFTYNCSYGQKQNAYSEFNADKTAGILGQSPSMPPPLKASSKCQIWGLYNHDALDCNVLFNHAYASNKLHKSLAAMHLDESANTNWYPKSGPSAHMTS